MAEPAIKFDTAAAVEQLVEAGVPQKQAAAQVRLLATTINENFATKADIERLEIKLGTDIAELRAATKADIERLELKLDTGIAELRAEVHTDIAHVRTGIAELRAEVHTDIAHVRTGIAELRAEVHTDIAHVRTNIAEVRTEVANLETRLTGKVGELDVRLQNTLKWTAGMQIGTILAIVAAVKLI